MDFQRWRTWYKLFCGWYIQLIAFHWPEECSHLPGVLDKCTGAVPLDADIEVSGYLVVWQEGGKMDL